MKKVIFFLFFICQMAQAQQPIQQRRVVAKQFTSCANSFLKSLTNLAADIGTQTCGVGTNINTDVFGEMTGGCYASSNNTTSRISYTMFKSSNTTSLAIQYRPIRVIWGNAKSVYDYYGVCTPPNLVYELPEGTQNHVFEAVLVPIDWYKGFANAAAKTYDDWKKACLSINTVAKIQNFRFESFTGYIATNEKTNYNNVYSSKGIIVNVMSNGKSIDCYLINNYDGSGTIAWKK